MGRQNGTAPASEDVRAMVRDRRSGRGKQAGPPAHLPMPPGGATRVGPGDLEWLNAAMREMVAAEERAVAARKAADEAVAALEFTKAALGFAFRTIATKYSLPDTHEVDLSTGEIRQRRTTT